MRKYGTTWAIFFLLLVLVVFAVSITSINRKEDSLTYSQLHNLIAEGKANQLTKVVVTNGETIIQVSLVGAHERAVIVPSETKEALIKELTDAHIPLEVKDPDKSSFWFSMISSFFLPILLLVGFLFMFRSAQSGYQPTAAAHTQNSKVTDLSTRMDLMEAEINDMKKQISDLRNTADSA